MTVSQAAVKWDVNERTVLDYIARGYIYGLSVSETAERNYVILPGIPKPLVKKKPGNVDQMDRYILEAMNKDMYVNAVILGISQEKFEERLRALMREGTIYPRDPEKVSFLSNLGFVKASRTQNSFRVEFSPTLSPKLEVKPTVEVKVADQIGLVNTDIKLPFGKSEG